MNKETHKKYVALLIMLAMVVCTMFHTNTAKAGIHNFDINGVPWILTTFGDADYHLCLKVGDNDTLYLDKDDEDLASAGIIDVGLDPNTGTIYILDSGHDIRWWNYYLQDHNSIIFGFIPRPTDEDEFAHVDDVSDLIIDYSNNTKLITGYETFSGEVCPLLTFDEMKECLGISGGPTLPPSTPTPTPGSTATPDPTPTATPVPTATPTPTNTEKPVITPKPTASPQPTVAPKVSIKKSSGYTCLSVGNKVVSKYKLKKGVLTWKGTKKSQKVKQVKQAGFIKKSKNLVYITKKGKAYTISQKGKKKAIVKKDAKKLIFKNGFVTKIRKKSGYVNVVNR